MYGPYVAAENMVAEDNELLWVNSASQLQCLEQNLMSDMLPTPDIPKILRECKLLYWKERADRWQEVQWSVAGRGKTRKEA